MWNFVSFLLLVSNLTQLQQGLSHGTTEFVDQTFKALINNTSILPLQQVKFKGAVSPVFSVPLNSLKTYFNGSVLLTVALQVYMSSYLLSSAGDGLDGSGLQLEKIGQFSSSSCVS